MFDYDSVPVEIWHLILAEVFHAPFVLDNSITPGGSYWRRQESYHDRVAYGASERERKRLCLVCRSWKEFADQFRYRWIVVGEIPGPLASKKDQEEVLKALEHGVERSKRREAGDESSDMAGMPIRITSFVTKDSEKKDLDNVIRHCSGRLSTLFIECQRSYSDDVFNIVVNNHSSMTNLQCLMLNEPLTHSTPLQAISEAFPRITGLTYCRQDHNFPSTPNDSLQLPELESLFLDGNSVEGLQFHLWRVPKLLRFIAPSHISRDPTTDSAISFVKMHGSQLVFLDLLNRGAGTLPIDFWNWCPSLVEFVASFSRLDLLAPVPAKHPLRYFIHMPDPEYPLAETSEEGTLWRNLGYLGREVEVTFVIKEWPDYLKGLAQNIGREEAEKRLRDIRVRFPQVFVSASETLLEEFLHKIAAKDSGYPPPCTTPE